ncbi:hypothetical protein scyTo_0012139 [Scyliorhinus torazame]|uniref:Laminin G domain-containing protein n=1 Tax=Scyliorhinus torazame TaxID=75743 RepID=A0A401P2N7_SCYTO|nr:hypothetical protein [Scyliorhinus torazame]
MDLCIIQSTVQFLNFELESIELLDDCYTAPPLQNLGFGSSFTFTVWLKPDLKDVMTVIEKAINGQTIFKLTISETGSMFYYRTSFGLEPPAIVNTRGKIHSNKWTHLAIQVKKNYV